MANLQMSGKYRIVKRLVGGLPSAYESDRFEIQMYSKTWYGRGKWISMHTGITQRESNNIYKFYPYNSYEEAETFLFQYFIEKDKTIQIDSYYEYQRYTQSGFC